MSSMQGHCWVLLLVRLVLGFLLMKSISSKVRYGAWIGLIFNRIQKRSTKIISTIVFNFCSLDARLLWSEIKRNGFFSKRKKIQLQAWLLRMSVDAAEKPRHVGRIVH